MRELISVIIPVYNVEEYLRPCLDSVLAQTYTDLEILLVDDGSTDGSGAICEEYARSDSRIRVIHKENGGQSSARNAGLDAATGALVTFIDSDDLVAPDMLEALYGILNGHKIAMCSRQKFSDAPQPQPETDKTEVWDAAAALEKMYALPRIIAPWGKLYRRELFDTFRFREGIIYEDEDALPQLIYAAGGMIYTPRELYFYRVRPGSTMTASFSEKRLDIIGVCQRRIALFEQWGLTALRRTAVKDYYLHLKRLEQQTAQPGLEEAHHAVVQAMEQWKSYGVKFSWLEKLRLLR